MKKAMVYGEGISGRGAKRLLQEMNYEVILVDDSTAIKTDEAMEKLNDIDIFIKSPGIPYNKLLKKVSENNIEIIDEIELTYRYLNRNDKKIKIIAVTGTNGKSTTTEKLSELINYAGYKCKACGNIGRSFADMILDNELDYCVIETSSFQLENIKFFKPYISMIINLTPDHIERYSSFEEYYDVKFNIDKNGDKNTFFIENIDDKNILNRENKINSNIITLSLNKKADAYVKDNWIYYKDEKIIKVDELSLKGEHNIQNCLFIIASSKLIKIDTNIIVSFLRNAKPLEHRTENFYNYGKVKFINDSKATNVDSAIIGIKSYKGSILICGGYDKGVDLLPLVESIKNNIKEVYLIGVIAEKLKELLLINNYPADKINLTYDIRTSLLKIKEKISNENDETILLSPATSSYDQFKSFEHRGREFKKLVLEIFSR